MLPEFLHEVFMEFSNTDEENKPSICYSDAKELFRLTNILSRDGKRVDTEQVELDDRISVEKDIKVPNIPKNEEDDPGLIDEEWL